eukprot:10995051-Alexandrium_andersonii.AAC.1
MMRFRGACRMSGSSGLSVGSLGGLPSNTTARQHVLQGRRTLRVVDIDEDMAEARVEEGGRLLSK